MGNIISDEYEKRKINAGFRYDVKELDPVKPIVGLIAREDDDKDDRVVCTTCTDSFFRIFVAEQTQDKHDLDNDPILQDIYSKKIYMTHDKQQGIYFCNGCGNKIVKDKSTITSPKRILKIAGVDPRNQFSEKQDFSMAVERTKSNEYELEYYDDKEVEGYDPKRY